MWPQHQEICGNILSLVARTPTHNALHYLITCLKSHDARCEIFWGLYKHARAHQVSQAFL